MDRVQGTTGRMRVPGAGTVGLLMTSRLEGMRVHSGYQKPERESCRVGPLEGNSDFSQPTWIILQGESQGNKYLDLILFPSCNFLLVFPIAEPKQKPENVGVCWCISYSSVSVGKSAEREERRVDLKTQMKATTVGFCKLQWRCFLWIAVVGLASLNTINPWVIWFSDGMVS